MMLILASGSPRRRELLGTHGVPFSIETPDVEELTGAPDPRKLPVFNAARKAEAVSARHPDAMVIGADTVILFDGRVIGKPRDPADAKKILAELSGREHEVVTGVSLRHGARGVADDFSVSSRVRFKPLTEQAIDGYLAKVPVLDKAGAYAIQEYGDELVAGFDGDLDNIIGLPCRELFAKLDGYGYRR